MFSVTLEHMNITCLEHHQTLLIVMFFFFLFLRLRCLNIMSIRLFHPPFREDIARNLTVVYMTSNLINRLPLICLAP